MASYQSTKGQFQELPKMISYQVVFSFRFCNLSFTCYFHQGDVHFDPLNKGNIYLPFVRSTYNRFDLFLLTILFCKQVKGGWLAV